MLDATWKFIDNSPNLDGSGPFELFDLRNDPREEHNLAGDPKQSGRIATYQKELTAWRATHPAPVRIPGMPMPVYAQSEGEGRRPRAPRPRRRP